MQLQEAREQRQAIAPGQQWVKVARVRRQRAARVPICARRERRQCTRPSPSVGRHTAGRSADFLALVPRSLAPCAVVGGSGEEPVAVGTLWPLPPWCTVRAGVAPERCLGFK